MVFFLLFSGKSVGNRRMRGASQIKTKTSACMAISFCHRLSPSWLVDTSFCFISFRIVFFLLSAHAFVIVVGGAVCAVCIILCLISGRSIKSEMFK